MVMEHIFLYLMMEDEEVMKYMIVLREYMEAGPEIILYRSYVKFPVHCEDNRINTVLLNISENIKTGMKSEPVFDRFSSM